MLLSILLWITAAFFTWGTLRMIANTGKTPAPRTNTPGVVAGATLIQAFFIVVIVLAALAVAR